MTTTRPSVSLSGRYTMTEAAAILGVNRKTLYRWRKLGYIKEKKCQMGTAKFITGREILKFYGV